MIANQKRAWAPSILRVLLVSLLLLAGNFSSAANAMSEPKPGDRRGPSYRVHLESMLSGGVAWLEVDSEYRVCAAKNMSAQAHCEPLEIPYLEAVTLSASKHGNGSAIGLTVPRGSQAIRTDVRVALQNRFANEIARVQALVQSRYEIANRMANIANPLKLSAKTVLVSVNSACDIEELGAPMPLSTSDCAPPWIPPGWNPDPWGGFGGGGSGNNELYCARVYAQLSASCRRLPDPQDRRICWANAAVAYASCLKWG